MYAHEHFYAYKSFTLIVVIKQEDVPHDMITKVTEWMSGGVHEISHTLISSSQDNYGRPTKMEEWSKSNGN